MSRKIVSTLALLCFLAMCNYAMAFDWNTTIVWHNAASDQNWFDAGNWVHNGGEPAGIIPPDPCTFVVIEPYAGPIIDGAATCSALAIGDWSWAGAPSSAVEVNSGTLNAGESIWIAANGTDFIYILLDANNMPLSAPGTFGLTVMGGTVTTPTGTTGITIGGGSLGYTAQNIGALTMYGGLINVPALALKNGTISLYGGTLETTTDSAFVFYQSFPVNKIDISGGTLQCTGNYTIITPTWASLIGGGLIYSSRGTIGTPVYDGNTNITTLSCVPGSVNMNIPWGPSPANGATNVHYRTGDVNTGITLQWNSGSEPNVINHPVYFGTDYNSVAFATEANTTFVKEVNEANAEPNSWLLGTYAFKINTNYYWRVDDNQITVTYDANDNPVSSYTTLIKGPVWTFRSHDGKASNPLPYNGRVGLAQPLALQWTKGDFATTHRVYIGTDAGSLTSDHGTSTSTKTYRGTVTTPSYSLSNLATNWFSNPALVAGNTYYWKVAEVNGTTVWGGGLSDYQLWNFTPTAVMTIDDFQDYNSTADINNANWSSGYDVTVSCNDDGVSNPNGNMTFVIDADGKHGNFWYKDRGAAYFSEERKSYSNISGGTLFAGNTAVMPSFAALRIDYKGASLNAVDPIYDRMYAAIEDTAGNIGVVPNPDPAASQTLSWTSWYVALNDANFTSNSVSLAHVKNFYLGFGKRCNDGTVSSIPGTTQDGNVMFDNLALYAQTCNPAVTLSADMDGDCDVDINDLAIFADYWLNKAELRTFATYVMPHKSPILWYKFNDSGNTTNVQSYGGDGNNYTGTVNNWALLNWNATGGRSGGPCLYIPPVGPFPASAQTYVTAPVGSLSFMDDANHMGDDAQDGGEVSFSIWTNANLAQGDDFWDQWGSIFGIWDAAGEWDEIPLPSHLGTGGTGFVQGQANYMIHNYHVTPATTASVTEYLPFLDFGGRWNHWAFIKTPTSMMMYHNGLKIGETDANGQDGDPNARAGQPMWSTQYGLTAFRIATRGTNWAMWAGKLADFQMYDYALSDAEIAGLATDNTGQLLIPLSTKANLYINEGEPSPSAGDANQIVDFKDLSVMGLQWHSQQLWP